MDKLKNALSFINRCLLKFKKIIYYKPDIKGGVKLQLIQMVFYIFSGILIAFFLLGLAIWFSKIGMNDDLIKLILGPIIFILLSKRIILIFNIVIAFIKSKPNLMLFFTKFKKLARFIAIVVFIIIMLIKSYNLEKDGIKYDSIVIVIVTLVVNLGSKAIIDSVFKIYELEYEKATNKSLPINKEIEFEKIRLNYNVSQLFLIMTIYVFPTIMSFKSTSGITDLSSCLFDTSFYLFIGSIFLILFSVASFSASVHSIYKLYWTKSTWFDDDDLENESSAVGVDKV